eukprot:750004-Hanusia_phi.AAC.3
MRCKGSFKSTSSTSGAFSTSHLLVLLPPSIHLKLSRTRLPLLFPPSSPSFSYLPSNPLLLTQMPHREMNTNFPPAMKEFVVPETSYFTRDEYREAQGLGLEDDGQGQGGEARGWGGRGGEEEAEKRLEEKIEGLV